MTTTNDILRTLVQCFPLAFAPNPERRRPLKKGIGADVRELLLECDKRDVSHALHRWTHYPSYLKKCAVGATRVDLWGQECGEVAEEDALYAKERLDELREAKRRRRKEKELAAKKEKEKEKETKKVLENPNANKPRLGLFARSEASP